MRRSEHATTEPHDVILAERLRVLLTTSLRPASAGPEALEAALGRARSHLARQLSGGSGDGNEIGLLYQRLLMWEARQGPDGEVRVMRSARARKAGGVYYTPRRIADAIATATLSPLTAGASLAARSLPDGAPLDALAEPFLSIRVLDPAMGCGSFLLSAADVIARAMHSEPRIAAALGLNECRALAAEDCLFGIDLDAEAVGLARTALSRMCGRMLRLGRHLRAGDALREPWGSPDAFDAVIGNPPWVSFSGRQAEPLSGEDRRFYSQRFEGFRGWLSAQGLFIELAVRLCRPGGRAGMVAPAQICGLRGYAPLRRAVTSLARLDGPALRLGEHEFDGVTGPAAIYVFERLPDGGSRGADDVWEWRTDISRAHTSPVAQAIVEKMRRFPPLPKETFTDPGVHTGNSAELLLSREPQEGDGWAPVREGRDIAPFRLAPPRLWLRTQPELPAGRYCRICPLERYAAARILIRQTASRPVAARHTCPGYFRNSLLACAGVLWLPDEALAAILNSRLAAFFHRHSFCDSRQGAFPQVKVSHLRAIPVPREIPGAACLELTRLAREAETNGADADTLARIDRAVFGLYGLASAEIETVLSDEIARV